MSNILNMPQSAPVTPATGQWTTEWLQWILNPKVQTLTLSSALGTDSGGTGLTTAPPVGALLVGDGTGYQYTTTIPSSSLPGVTGDATMAPGTSVITFNTVNAGIGVFGSSTRVPQVTVNAKGLITAAVAVDINGSPGSFVAGANLIATTGFGCNGKGAQNSVAVSAAIGGTAGAAYTAVEQGLINSLIAQITQLRTALVGNGISI